MLSKIVSVCSERFKNYGIELKVEGELSQIEFEGRGVQISQALINLLANAQEAVENESIKDKWIRISCRQIGGAVAIRVEDSGAGVPENIRSKIMQPFFTTKPIGQGIGLGLSVAKGIVENHGGTLDLEINSPHTCFVVKLPKEATFPEKRAIAAA